ncbi:MAG: hypothetical protein VX830_02800 [Candidatus Poribacteria bacterium]|nr:hypothetical protein [Candidatus Poribacteria bacterium]|tara:strand:+ start:1587 stop:2714 length:1128 start_codon:yes stop_codon:yes gene_type:complete
MAHAYTPGLKISAQTIIRSERRLPLMGDVLVEVGNQVSAEDIVAQTDLPGNVQMIHAANLMGTSPSSVGRFMLKKVGDPVEQGEIIAQSNGLFGLFKSEVKSPISGTIENISDVTGQVVIREPATPVQTWGYIDGQVIEVMENEGAVIETWGTLIQGIFGIGGETVGQLQTIVDSPHQPLTPELIQADHEGQILVGGSTVDRQTVEFAIDKGVKGIVCGGIDDRELYQLLGYELGVAITGSEQIGLTLMITEGFGQISMAKQTFDLLLQRQGMKSSLNGTTQIRAGVQRPEIVIPLEKDGNSSLDKDIATIQNALDVGTQVRLIRSPYFGQLGEVTKLLVEPQSLETEAQVRVLEVQLHDQERIVLPRANVEIVE